MKDIQFTQTHDVEIEVLTEEGEVQEVQVVPAYAVNTREELEAILGSYEQD